MFSLQILSLSPDNWTERECQLKEFFDWKMIRIMLEQSPNIMTDDWELLSEKASCCSTTILQPSDNSFYLLRPCRQST